MLSKYHRAHSYLLAWTHRKQVPAWMFIAYCAGWRV